jgi:hypothetical protein
MDFVGSAVAMIASIKINKRTRISTFEKIKDFKKSKKRDLHFDNKTSPKELQEINAIKILKEKFFF